MIQPTMRRDRDSLSTESRDLSLWPTIDLTSMASLAAERAGKLLHAVRAYIQGEPVKRVAHEAGISRQELYRLVRRCLAQHPDGRIWGFRALVSGHHQEPYQRIAPIDGPRRSQHGGGAGALTMLFERYPKIQRAVDGLFLKKVEAQIVYETRMPVKVLHKRFIDACREEGLTARDYPFNMNHRARRALSSYLRRLFKQHLSTAVSVRHGDDAARALASSAAGPGSIVTRPYERVEFDGHLLDLFCTIDLPNPYGGIQTLTLDRLWLLAIIDTKSRSILGYVVSFNREYTAEDVLRCVKHALMPWKPMELTIPGLTYAPGSGLPSGVLPECAWALWDELWFDNAKANLADAVRTNLTRVVGCAINAGPMKTPQRRPHVERLFQTLEENGFHRLPSTTGSGPDDSRRNQPEAAALRWHLSYHHLLEIIDVLVARYNAEPHAGLGYRSPLEMLEYFITHEEYDMRTLPEQKRQDLALLNIRVVRRIRGDVKQGKCPYVEYGAVRYYNDVLRRSPDLIGQPLTLLVDPEDLRCLMAYLDDGQEFGVMTAHGFWGRTPHSLTTRKAINQLRLKKLIFYTDTDDPILTYMEYLNQQAATSKRARGQAAKIHATVQLPTPTPPDVDPTQPSHLQPTSPPFYTPVMRKTRLY